MKQHPSSPNSENTGEFTPERMQKARLRIGLKDVSREEWQAAVREKAGQKVHLDIELDADVFAWLEDQTDEQGYQTLINATLRRAMENQPHSHSP